MNGKEIIIDFHSVGKFQINIDIALRRFFAFGKRTKNAYLACAKRLQFCGMGFYQG